MAWSEAARQAALEARRAHAKAKASVKKMDMDKLVKASSKYPITRASVAYSIRQGRAGRPGYGGKDMILQAAASTRARNLEKNPATRDAVRSAENRLADHYKALEWKRGRRH